MVREFLRKIQEKGRLPSGLLFYGKEGSGKTKTALELARGILCKEGKPWGCGECSSCRYMTDFEKLFWRGETEDLRVYEEAEGKKSFLYLMGEHPDFVCMIPHGNYIKIDQVRAVKEFAHIKPALSRRKVVLIDDAHTMTNQAANALLKVLEEPPPDTTFILTTSRIHALPRTVISRTFQLEFTGFSPKQVMEILGVDEETAKLSGGSLKRALLLKEKKHILEKVGEFLKGEPLTLYRLSEEFEKWETEEKKLFLDLLEEKVMEELREGRREADEVSLFVDKIRLFRDGLPRGVNGSLWIYSLSLSLGG